MTRGTSSDAWVVYTADSALRRPREFLRAMRRDLATARELAWRLLRRDLQARYRQSVFGVLWAFGPPIMLAAGLTLATRTRVLDVGVTALPFPAYVMLGTVLWQTFTDALTGPIRAFGDARNMLLRINFPREAIVLAKIGEVFFDLGVKSVLVAAIFFWWQIPLAWSLLITPGALLALVLLGTLIGLMLVPLSLLYQDVERGLGVFTLVWLLFTPVAYPLPATGRFAQLVRWNPVTPVLVTARELATGAPLSDPGAFLLVVAVTLLCLVVTWVAVRLAMPIVIQRLGA